MKYDKLYLSTPTNDFLEKMFDHLKEDYDYFWEIESDGKEIKIQYVAGKMPEGGFHYDKDIVVATVKAAFPPDRVDQVLKDAGYGE
jgi:hypothetical protein